MRDRVTLTGNPAWGAATRTIRKILVLAALPAALVVVTAGSAGAATPGSGQVPFSVAGPVGFGAVVVGIGGLVIGLLRRRKLATSRPVPVAGRLTQTDAAAATTPLEPVVADERAA